MLRNSFVAEAGLADSTPAADASLSEHAVNSCKLLAPLEYFCARQLSTHDALPLVQVCVWHGVLMAAQVQKAWDARSDGLLHRTTCSIIIVPSDFQHHAPGQLQHSMET